MCNLTNGCFMLVYVINTNIFTGHNNKSKVFGILLILLWAKNKPLKCSLNHKGKKNWNEVNLYT